MWKRATFSDYISILSWNTVVVVYINTMKTTLDFNFNFYQALKQHGYT